ncbi:putative polyol transporter [Lachnellula occidentalis]|uniref:Putative polyol transporter n=1 Tax=Lachnellula occidentalis TaxID=215460 RepID=A0A8H8U759_9HELO|nr:putative polyol transporter [Lachnellula occidentalis]
MEKSQSDIAHVEDNKPNSSPDPEVASSIKDEFNKDRSSAEVDNFIDQMERDLAPVAKGPGFFRPTLNDPRHLTWIMVTFASMGGILFGLDQSLISGANITMPAELGFNTQQVSWINSFMPLGAVFGSFLLGPANEYLGRRGAIILSTIFYTVGAALEAGAMNFGMMIAGRLVLGVGLGIEVGTVPVYVAESVGRKVRGNLVSLYQFNIALGEVLGFVVAAIFIKVESSWRFILGSSLLFSTIMFVGMLFLPESPRFLMHQGKTLEAYAIWKRIRGIEAEEARWEFFIMAQTVQEERQQNEGRKSTGRPVWMDFIFVPRARRAFIYANTMMLLGQFVGINGIMYYMSVLMSQIGFNTVDATYMSMVGGGALFLGTIPAILYMEKFGRRFWANTMLPGFFIGLVIIAASYMIPLNPETQHKVEGLYITGLILYMGFYGPYACLTWVIPSEVYPTYLRSYGMMFSDGAVNLGNFIITFTFTDMQKAMTKQGLTLGFFGGIAALGFVYQIVFMPETKDRTLEEIELVFAKPTRQLARENIAATTKCVKQILTFRFREAFDGIGAESKDGEKRVYDDSPIV